MVDVNYETPIYSPCELLAVVGVPERVFQIWVQRGYAPRTARPGRGIRRTFSLSDLLIVGFLRTATEAHVPLAEAAVAAMHIFPALEVSVPPVVLDVIRRSDRLDLAPQVFAVLQDGRDPLVLREEQLLEASEGSAWFTAIDLTRLVSTTVTAAEAILAQRTAA